MNHIHNPIRCGHCERQRLVRRVTRLFPDMTEHAATKMAASIQASGYGTPFFPTGTNW